MSKATGHSARPRPPSALHHATSHRLTAFAKAQLESRHNILKRLFVAPAPCGDADATDDIFFLEVCLFNQICSNGHELFRLQIGQHWQCHFDEERFDELRRILLEPPKGRTRNPFYPKAPIEGENAVGR